MRAPFRKTDRRRRQRGGVFAACGVSNDKRPFQCPGWTLPRRVCGRQSRPSVAKGVVRFRLDRTKDKTFVTVVQVEGLSGTKSGEKGTVRSEEKKKKLRVDSL